MCALNVGLEANLFGKLSTGGDVVAFVRFHLCKLRVAAAVMVPLRWHKSDVSIC